jgi:hypothetical protein
MPKSSDFTAGGGRNSGFEFAGYFPGQRFANLLPGQAMASTSGSAASSQPPAGTLSISPFVIQRDVTIDRIGFREVGGSTSDTGKLAIYRQSDRSLVLDAGTVSFTASPGVREVAISQRLEKGVYFLALRTNTHYRDLVGIIDFFSQSTVVFNAKHDYHDLFDLNLAVGADGLSYPLTSVNYTYSAAWPTSLPTLNAYLQAIPVVLLRAA